MPAFARAICVAMLIGGALGCFAFPAWQHSVETAQILANSVQYPDLDNPYYRYHAASVTLPTMLSALLLKAFGELVASALISGLQGALSYGAIAALAFPFFARWQYAAMLAPVVHALGILQVGAAYPIELMGYTSTFGVIGVGYFALCTGLFVNRKGRSAALAAGLFPLVHPSLALLFAVNIAAYFFVQTLLRAEESWRDVRQFALLSVPLFSACSIVFLLLSGGWPPEPLSDLARATTVEFIDNWSMHHRDYPFASPTGLAFLVLTAAILLYAVRSSLSAEQGRLVWFLAVLALLAVAFAAASHLPTRLMPLTFWQLMPPRIPNLVMIMAPIALIGLAMTSESRFAEHLRLGAVAATLLALLVLASMFPSHVLYVARMAVGWLAVVILSVAMAGSWLLDRRTQAPASARPRAVPLLSLVLVLALAALVAFSGHPRRGDRLTYYGNDAFFARLHADGDGYLLSSETELVQIRSGRPVLVSLAFNQGLYFPQTWAGMLQIYRDVYEVEAETLSQVRGGGLMPEVYRDAWEARDHDHWLRLAEEYGFSDVITRRGLFLDLPLVGEERDLLQYSLKAGARARIVAPERNIIRAFDRSIGSDSYWQSDSYPAAIEIAYEAPLEVSGYSLTVGEGGGGRPRDWVVEGKQATGPWRILDRQVDWAFDDRRTQEFQMPSEFIDRLRITFTRGRDGPLRLFEMRIRGDCLRPDMAFVRCDVF